MPLMGRVCPSAVVVLLLVLPLARAVRTDAGRLGIDTLPGV